MKDFFMALAQFFQTVLSLRLDEEQKSIVNLRMQEVVNTIGPALREAGKDSRTAGMIGDLLKTTSEMLSEEAEKHQVATQHAEERIRKAEDYDKTTGFLKGDAFKREFCKRLRTRRSEERVWVLAYLDLRNFRWWNNTFKQHEVGTAALETLSNHLRHQVRSHQTEIGRLHERGDEFALFSTLQVEDGNSPMAAAQSLIRRLTMTLDMASWEMNITSLLRSREQERFLIGRPNVRPIRVDVGAVVWEIPKKFGREDVEEVADKLISAADREMFIIKEAVALLKEPFPQSSYRIVSLAWNFRTERFKQSKDRSRGVVSNVPSKR